MLTYGAEGLSQSEVLRGLYESSKKLHRPNLHILRHTVAEQILFDDDNTATAVVVRGPGGAQTLSAAREIILAAGAVDTPKLLQLSGIGDKDLLAEHNIPVVHNAPAVGQNLQDHVCVSYYYRANIKTLNDDLGSLFGQAKAGLQYLLTRRGPLSMSVNQAGGFFKGSADEALPNLQLYFNPMSYRIPDDPNANLVPEPYSGFLVAFNSCRPTSKGCVEIASGNPSDAPLIKPNYLSTDKDIEEVIQGNRLIRHLMQAPALKAVTVEEVSPAAEVHDEASMVEFFRQNAGSIYHLCGTCTMGPDPQTAVVDTRLRVHGVKGLRVIDASIFPNITSGNINAPVMMVAEKGADMVLQDHSA
ncbi:MAG: hypothetical protein RL336_394 [Pseudomonadota bacterium]|jgi:choline dehydrogenase